jgi:glycosyltransferase involved in cell wall biosynthesis
MERDSDVENILYLINSLETGGAEVGMSRLINGLSPEKYDLTVVALDGRDPALLDRLPSWISVRYLYPDVIKGQKSIWQFIWMVRRADVIVGSLFHASMLAKLCGVVNHRATVAVWRHNTQFKTRTRKRAFKLTTSLCDVVLADSEPVFEALVNDVGLDESIVYTVPIAGININEYVTVKHKCTSAPVVGTVGRLTEQKNHATTLEVADRLQKSEISFTIAGEGALRETLEQEINERGLTNVTLRGYVDDVPSFLSGLDIYFQPSRFEGLCITVLEAMAAGLPVVGSNVDGIGRNVHHGKSGFLYNPCDTDRFVDAIRTLAADPQLRSEFGSYGRQTVVEGFTQEALVSRFKRAIREAKH